MLFVIETTFNNVIVWRIILKAYYSFTSIIIMAYFFDRILLKDLDWIIVLTGTVFCLCNPRTFQNIAARIVSMLTHYCKVG